MRIFTNKWNLLIVALAVWMAAGVMLFALDQAGVTPATPSDVKPERIVCTAPNLVEILFALGLGDKLVGVPGGSKYPPAAKDIPSIGSFWQPAIEPIIAKRPDLVITLEFPQQKSLARRLGKIGYKTLTVNIEQVDELFEAIHKIGTVTYFQPQSEKLVADIKQKIAELSEKLASDQKPKVLWVVQRDPLRVAGTETFVNDLIELAGGVNAIGKTVHQYPPIGSEQVYLTKPDIIIEPAMISGDINVQLAGAKEYWQKFNIPATNNKRIYVIEGDTVSQLGPRLYEGIEAIGKCLRPELFEGSKNE